MVHARLAHQSRRRRAPIKGELFPAFLAYRNKHDCTVLFPTRAKPEAIPTQPSFSEQRDVAFMVEGLEQAQASEQVGF